MCYEKLLLFFSLGLVPILSQSQTPNNCFSGWSNMYDNKINDVDVNKILGEYEILAGSLVIGRSSTTIENKELSNYFTLSQNDTHVIFSTNDLLINIDAEIDEPVSNSYVTTLFIATLTCDGEDAEARTFVPVYDTNNYNPEFSSTEYSISVPMPIVKDVPYSSGDIVASDLDFTNTDITFKIDPDDFEITSQKDKKNFKPILTARKTFSLKEATTYTLTATDNGEPKREATATLTIEIDQSSSIDVPTFLKSSYSFTYSLDTGGNPILTSSDDQEIIADTNNVDGIKNIAITGEYDSYFKTPERVDNTFTVDLKKPLPENVPSTFTATLEFETDYVAKTAIVITLDQDFPSFGSPSYSFSYKINNNNNEPILEPTDGLDVIADTTKVDAIKNIKLDGDYVSFFDKPKLDGNTFSISLKELLPSTAPPVITTTLQFETDHVAKTAIVIAIEQDILDFPSFESSSYSFNYIVNDNNKPVLQSTDSQDIVAIAKVNEIKNVILVGEYASFFDEPTLDGNTFSISLKELLPSTAPPVITTTLQFETDHVAKTAIVIAIEQDILDFPSFESSSYSFNYIVNDNNEPVLQSTDSQDIVAIAKVNEIKNVILVGEYASFFDEPTLDGNTFSISLKELLPSTAPPVITTTLQFETDHVAKTAIVIAIEQDILDFPSFESSSYSFNYIVNDNNEPVLQSTDSQDIVAIAKVNEIKNVILVGEYASFFDEPTLDGNTFSISLKELLPSTAPPVITTTLQFETDHVAKTAIVIAIEQDILDFPSFESSSYSFNYIVNDNNEPVLQSTDGQDIVADSAKVNEIKNVILVGEYASLFNEPTLDVNAFSISLKELLPSTAPPVITTTLQFETDHVAKTAIVITIEQEGLDFPSFKSSSYSFNYVINDNNEPVLQSTDSQEIAVDTGKVNDIKNVALIGEYALFFDEPKLDGNKFSVSLKELLPNTAPPVITTSLQFETDHQAKTAIIIQTRNRNLHFDESYYFGTYDSTNHEVVLDKSIKVVNLLPDQPDVTVIGEYTGKVEIDCDDKLTCSIKILNLDVSDLAANQIIVEMLAQVGSSDNAAAIVLIKFPKTLELQFTESSYSTNYIVQSDGTGNINDVEIALVNVEDPSTIVIGLDKYNEYFKISPISGETSKWKLQMEKNIPKNLLMSNEQLTTALIAVVGTSSAQAILTISLPVIEPVEFSENHYLAGYIIGDGEELATLEMHVKISLSRGDPESVDILLDEYGEEFKIFPIETGKWTVEIQKNLDQDILDKNTNLVIPLTVTDKSYEFLKDHSVLIIDLLQDAPHFSEPFYSADYSVDGGEHTISDTNIIVVDKDGSEPEITLAGTYADHFTLQKVDDHHRLAIANNLNENIINEEISITLTAAAIFNGVKSSAPIVINLPRKVFPADITFEKVLYSGSIDKEGNLEISGDIKVTTEKDDKDISSVIISAEFEKYFSISYKEGIVSISYSTIKIPEDILQKTTLISLELVISIQGSTEQARAVLNVAVDRASKEDNEGDSNIGYIIALSVVCVLLVGFIAGSILLWYLKFRSHSFKTLQEDFSETSTPNFERKSNTSEIVPEPVAKRRPTGFVFNSSLVEQIPDEPGNDYFETKKPVNEHLETIKPQNEYMETKKPENEYVETEQPGYDYVETKKAAVEREKPKSVVFDDVVKEMHIEVHDDTEEEEQSDTEENSEKIHISDDLNDSEESRL